MADWYDIDPSNLPATWMNWQNYLNSNPLTVTTRIGAPPPTSWNLQGMLGYTNIPGLTIPSNIQAPSQDLSFGNVYPRNIPNITFPTQFGALPSTLDVSGTTPRGMQNILFPTQFGPLPRNLDISGTQVTGALPSVNLPVNPLLQGDLRQLFPVNTQFQNAATLPVNLSRATPTSDVQNWLQGINFQQATLPVGLSRATPTMDIQNWLAGLVFNPSTLPVTVQRQGDWQSILAGGIPGQLPGTTLPVTPQLRPSEAFQSGLQALLDQLSGTGVNVPLTFGVDPQIAGSPMDFNPTDWLNIWPGGPGPINRNVDLGYQVRPTTTGTPATLDPRDFLTILLGGPGPVTRDVGLTYNVPRPMLNLPSREDRPVLDPRTLLTILNDPMGPINRNVPVTFDPSAKLTPIQQSDLANLNLADLLRYQELGPVRRDVGVQFTPRASILPGEQATLDINDILRIVGDPDTLQRTVPVQFMPNVTLQQPMDLPNLDIGSLLNVRGEVGPINRNVDVGFNVNRPTLNLPPSGERPQLNINDLLPIVNSGQRNISQTIDPTFNVRTAQVNMPPPGERPVIDLDQLYRLARRGPMTEDLDITLRPNVTLDRANIQGQRLGLQDITDDQLARILQGQGSLNAPLSITPSVSQRLGVNDFLSPEIAQNGIPLNFNVSGLEELQRLQNLGGTIQLQGPASWPGLDINDADLQQLGRIFSGFGQGLGGLTTALENVVQEFGEGAGKVVPGTGGLTEDQIRGIIGEVLAPWESRFTGLEQRFDRWPPPFEDPGGGTNIGMGGDINIYTNPPGENLPIGIGGGPSTAALDALINQIVEMTQQQFAQRFPIEGFLRSRTTPFAARGLQDILLPAISPFDPYGGPQSLDFGAIPSSAINPFTMMGFGPGGGTVPFRLPPEAFNRVNY